MRKVDGGHLSSSGYVFEHSVSALLLLVITCWGSSDLQWETLEHILFIRSGSVLATRFAGVSEVHSDFEQMYYRAESEFHRELFKYESLGSSVVMQLQPHKWRTD